MSKYTERLDKLRKEHRFKIYVISKDILWDTFVNGLSKSRFYYTVDKVPENAILDNVGWDFNYNGVVYRVLHESFEPVQEGTMAIVENLTPTVTYIPDNTTKGNDLADERSGDDEDVQ